MPPTDDLEFSMAVLCYRAEQTVIPFVEGLHRFLSLFAFDWEILLVANYWPEMEDATPGVARDLAGRLDHVRCIAEPKRGGMGWDMRAGLEACRGRYIGVIDGDGQFPAEAVFSCLAKIKIDDLDFVKTYRVDRDDGLYRNVVSSVYNRLFRLLFPAYRGFHDVNGKPKILKREAYQRMRLSSTDWFIDAELVLNALQLGLSIYEVPVRFNSLGDRRSFVKPAAIWEFLLNLLRYRLRHGTPAANR